VFSAIPKTFRGSKLSSSNSGYRFPDPNPFRGKPNTDFIKQLEGLGFRYDFDSNGSLYLWNADLKIEFITPLKGRGLEHTVRIRPLGFNAIPLRHVELLLNNPITVVENGIRIRVPNPANFCLHKLIIASRRKKADKNLKDLQQAVYTSEIVDSRTIKDLFETLPKKWKIAILTALEKAKETMPLSAGKIDDLILTLQDRKKGKM